MRKLFFLVAALVLVVPVSSQILSRRSEFTVSYGVAPATDWIDSYSDGLKSSGTDSSIDGWGAVTVGYGLRLPLGLTVGIQGVYSSNENRVNGVATGITNTYWSVMPNLKWRWLNLRIVSIYMRAAAGTSFRKSEIKDSNTDPSKDTRFAFQVSPFGIEVGGPIAAYAEAGVGMSGCLQVGVRYRF